VPPAASSKVPRDRPGYAKVLASAPAHVEIVRRLVIDWLTKQQLNQLGRASETILTELHPTSDRARRGSLETAGLTCREPAPVSDL
jgi:hypothetical protein